MTASNGDNLLQSLHKYAKANGQDENFTTAAFVHLLQHLKDYEYPLFTSLVKNLTKMDLGGTTAGDVSILHQRRNDGEQPDFQLSTPLGTAVVEIKLDAKLTIKDVSYLQGDSNVVRILLTRDRLNLSSPEFDSVIQIRWEDVAQWLADAAKGAADKASRYLICQFRNFLVGIGATIPKPAKAHKGSGGLVFIREPDPNPGKFMYALAPLVMKEFSIDEMIDVFLHGIIDRSTGAIRNDIFEDEPWILDRSFIVNGLSQLFGLGGGIIEAAASATIRNWIIGQVMKRGLDPKGTFGEGHKDEIHRTFRFLKYPGGGRIEELKPEEITTLGGSIPIRAVCICRWFEQFGGNSCNARYFGNWPINEVSFYGTNGVGGRFPLRPGTWELVRDLF